MFTHKMTGIPTKEGPFSFGKKSGAPGIKWDKEEEMNGRTIEGRQTQIPAIFGTLPELFS